MRWLSNLRWLSFNTIVGAALYVHRYCLPWCGVQCEEKEDQRNRQGVTSPSCSQPSEAIGIRKVTGLWTCISLYICVRSPPLKSTLTRGVTQDGIVSPCKNVRMNGSMEQVITHRGPNTAPRPLVCAGMESPAEL
ncbi:hypothetical protein JTE90_023504 [Oedothorax gibbosus]|uniref:Secreted protein n=1 Tax=Oedothorax gibbosus TaxID=931172 RepID=A0AAV6VQ60_9ARAC|nr:hypothetical protein JTE90_023504 [Oedothorax gibbosus]